MVKKFNFDAKSGRIKAASGNNAKKKAPRVITSESLDRLAFAESELFYEALPAQLDENDAKVRDVCAIMDVLLERNNLDLLFSYLEVIYGLIDDAMPKSVKQLRKNESVFSQYCAVLAADLRDFLMCAR